MGQLEQLLHDPSARRAVASLGKGPFSFEASGPLTDSGRCHILFGEGVVVVFLPRAHELRAWATADVADVDYRPGRALRRDALVVTFADGYAYTFTEVERRVPARYQTTVRALFGWSPLLTLRGFEEYASFAARRFEETKARSTALAQGEIPPLDLRLLGEDVLAADWSRYLAWLMPPYPRDELGLPGFVAAGRTRLAFVAYRDSDTAPSMPWSVHEYDQVFLAAWLVDESAGTALVEIASRNPSPAMEGSDVTHSLFLLPAPGLFKPNVTDAILLALRDRGLDDRHYGIGATAARLLPPG